MSLLLRLFLTILFARRRGPLHVLDTCVTPYRVLLNDLDVLRHMTNSRYFSIMDLARVDLMIRSGLWKRLNARGWYPVVTLETMRFHRSLELNDRYQVTTRVIGWDDRQIFLEQGFVRDGMQVALGVVRTRFLKRAGGTVSVAELMELAQVSQPSPMLPEWVVRWSEADGGMQTSSRASQPVEETTTSS
ncbi:acyl-CoA thioesterase [Paraburkholderia phosphatilytica]|uniref:acyl-CoA thioesterase n=1 Tax=Paraburkholderia phosphatilytica TaxID=2282883 RepID=UPI000E49798C|nr:acyl-CoA thioesterase [Paraburkholderia phosphatilytica]